MPVKTGEKQPQQKQTALFRFFRRPTEEPERPKTKPELASGADEDLG